jgi:hypothetical protein
MRVKTSDCGRRPRNANRKEPQYQQTRMVTAMIHSHGASAGDPIDEPMVAFARCSKLQGIIVGGQKSVELASEINGRGNVRVASAAKCRRAARQYDVELFDWRPRTFKALETTLDWLLDFLGPVWIDAQRPAVRQDLCSGLKRRVFVIEDRAGSAVSSRRC